MLHDLITCELVKQKNPPSIYARMVLFRFTPLAAAWGVYHRAKSASPPWVGEWSPALWLLRVQRVCRSSLVRVRGSCMGSVPPDCGVGRGTLRNFPGERGSKHYTWAVMIMVIRTVRHSVVCFRVYDRLRMRITLPFLH